MNPRPKSASASASAPAPTSTSSSAPALTTVCCHPNNLPGTPKQLREFVFGMQDAGKTTALRTLIDKLTQGQPYHAAVRTLMASCKDLRIILPLDINKKVIWVYVATSGDTDVNVLTNIEFFNGNLQGRNEYYIAQGNQVYKHQAKATSSVAIPTLPHVCVGACRNSLASYYAKDNLDKINRKLVGKIVWRELIKPDKHNPNAYGGINGVGRFIPVNDIVEQMYDDIMDWVK